MTVRDDIEQTVQGLIDFALVTASAVTASAKQVTVTLLGVRDDDGNEQRSGQALYGNAAVLLRPAAAEGSGDDQVGMEVVFVRSGDDMVPIAHRETRWQVDLEEGEVVVRALSDSAARVRLKPNGDCIIESTTNIKLGSDSASEGIPLGDSLKSWLDGHKHSYVGGGTGSGNLLSTGPALDAAGTPSTSPDPSSVSKVE